MVKRRLFIAFLLLCAGFMVCMADEVDSLWSEVQALQGQAKLAGYEKLYNLTLMSDDTDRQLKCLNEWRDEARKQHVVVNEAFVLVNRTLFFYANDLNDSIYKYTPQDRDYMKERKLWKEYYELWAYLSNTYIYTGKANIGLHEVQSMFDDATKRKNEYGMGVAYATMGNAYMALGDLNESAESYQKGLDILLTLSKLYPVITEVYPNYGDVLNERKEYDKLDVLTANWKKFLYRYIKQHKLAEDGYEANTFWSYYYLARVQACLGMERYDEAAKELEEVGKRVVSEDDYVGQKHLFYRAELSLRKGKLAEALTLNTKRMQQMEATDDKSVLIMVRQQRAQIMEKLGRYAEAADIYHDMYRINDSINSYGIKNQLNEMNTIFKVDELKMEQERAQYRNIIIFVSILMLALAVFLIYRLRAARLLRQAHDKLEQTHSDLLVAYDNLEETTKAKERIESDLRIARDIQMSMVPAQFPERTDLDLYASMTPAKEVGGDLYDYLLLNGTTKEGEATEKLYFALGDVSGKGVPASLFMAQATRLFHTLAKLQMKPAEIATRLNEELAADNEQGMFVTMFIGVADLKTGKLEFCNAGHNPPVLEGQFLEMIPNAPIGLWPGLDYEGEEVEDISGKPLFVYTDGLNEAENQKQEQFTDERLVELLSAKPFESARQTVEMLRDEVEKHRDGAEPNDDLTMLCFRIDKKKSKTNNTMKKEIKIKNQIGELERVAQFVEEIGEEMKLDMELQMNLNLVMEEMVSNVIFYAYPEGTVAEIELTAESDGKELTFVLSDQGKEFDPTLKQDADPDVNPAEREIGGMGIFIVKNIMNQVTYQRLEGKNLLTMKKDIA